jgi:cobalt-precorrin 5A hydrolase / precorrin-3B C17-methyltransferase
MQTLVSYPITLTSLHGAHVVVVGGGAVGERKVRGLLAAGAAVRLISPAATEQLQSWAAAGQISWEQREYATGDLDGARLAFAATNRRHVNAQIARDAAIQGLLCNVADAPNEGSFHLPAVYRGQGVTIAVSTDGASPARAVAVRDALAQWLSREEPHNEQSDYK